MSHTFSSNASNILQASDDTTTRYNEHYVYVRTELDDDEGKTQTWIRATEKTLELRIVI